MLETPDNIQNWQYEVDFLRTMFSKKVINSYTKDKAQKLINISAKRLTTGSVDNIADTDMSAILDLLFTSQKRTLTQTGATVVGVTAGAALTSLASSIVQYLARGRAAADMGLGPTDEGVNEDPADRPLRFRTEDPSIFIPGQGPPIAQQLEEDPLIKDTKEFVNSIDKDEIFKNNVLKRYLKNNKIDKDDLFDMKRGFEEWEDNASQALKDAAAAAGLSRGGMVYANNGMLIPYQPRGTDTVPAMLTPGEFVVNRSATQKNLPLLKAINNGAKGYSDGGVAYLEDGGDLFGYRSPRQTRRPMTREEKQKAEEDRQKQLQQQRENLQKEFALRRIGLSPFGQRAVYEMLKMPDTFEALNADAIRQDAIGRNLAQEVHDKIENFTESDKQAYLLNKAKEWTQRFEYLGKIANNSRLLLDTEGNKLNRPIPRILDTENNTRRLNISDILQQQVDAALKEGTAIKEASDLLKRTYARFVPGDAGGDQQIPQPVGVASGGLIYASKGTLVNYEPRGTDTIPAMLTPGEFVVNRNATRQNLSLLQAINSGSYSSGGTVKYLAGGTQGTDELRNNLAYLGSILSFGADNLQQSLNTMSQSVNSIAESLLSKIENLDIGVSNSSNNNTNPAATIEALGNRLDRFIEQLQNALPQTIKVEGNHNVNVVVNGGSILQNLLSGPIGDIVKQAVQNAFDQKNRESEGS